jgi:thiol-disulfide isomerase/thioredoxin
MNSQSLLPPVCLIPKPTAVFNRPRARTLVAAIAALVVTAAAVGAIGVGDNFPRLESSGLVGAAIPQTSGKVVLVDFWASWCAPCKASFPTYSRLNAEFSPQGLVIVAVSVDKDAAAYASFVKKFAPPFSVALDANQALVRLAEVPTMPTSYLMDRTGRVRFMHTGFHGASTEKELRQEIGELLSEAPR